MNTRKNQQMLDNIFNVTKHEEFFFIHRDKPPVDKREK